MFDAQTVIGLSEALDLEAVLSQLTSCDEEATVNASDLGFTHVT